MSHSRSLRRGIILMVLCTLFTAFGQLFFKLGARSFSLSIQGILLNYPLIIGFFFYGMGSLLLIFALRHGDLSQLYPFIALTFVWVLIIAVTIFHEVLNSFKIAAIILIVFGIIFIGGGGS
ncbi:hypothetical protein HYT55_01960 [Candidatus Woesearchaeota archaeon]|nr:hypothetical protein [Candidatus Woesearchaeota archaeon]